MTTQGNPDGSPAHTPSLRYMRREGFIDRLAGAKRMLCPGFLSAAAKAGAIAY